MDQQFDSALAPCELCGQQLEVARRLRSACVPGRSEGCHFWPLDLGRNFKDPEPAQRRQRSALRSCRCWASSLHEREGGRFFTVPVRLACVAQGFQPRSGEAWLPSFAEMHVTLRKENIQLEEPLHHVEAASVLHLGLTLFWRRGVRFVQEAFSKNTTKKRTPSVAPDVDMH